MPNLKRWVGRRTARSYYLSRLYYESLYWLTNIQAKDPIIIYQMGKVGSTSVLRSLQALRLSNPIFHVHTLTHAGRAGGRATYVDPIRSQFPRSMHLLVSQYLEREIRRPRNRNPWRIITLVRDPLAQNVSSFFQVVDTLMPNFRQKVEAGELDMGELRDTFLGHYPVGSIFNHWFERELRPVLGVDVYARPFPRSKGYEIYRGEQAEILLIRLESLNEYGARALSDFLGMEGISLAQENLGNAKPYSNVYSAFRETVALPRSHVDAIYDLSQARHFYTEEEIEGFRSRYRIEAT